MFFNLKFENLSQCPEGIPLNRTRADVDEPRELSVRVRGFKKRRRRDDVLLDCADAVAVRLVHVRDRGEVNYRIDLKRQKLNYKNAKAFR